MPTPTIPAGNLFMNATTYTGTGATQAVTNGASGASFQPDMVWIKERSQTQDHALFDSVRGATNQLSPNTTGAQATYASSMSAFNSNGFSVVSDAVVNSSGQTYVGWNWKAGGTAVTNTAGSISSQVSANTTSGFSIVTYTGNGTNGSTIGHGLGVTPSMIIVKSRSTAGTDWPVYHASLGATGIVALDATLAFTVISTPWNNTAPTSSVFTVGTSGDTNISARTYVAYCWAPIAGYSAFGSYTGNGSADGTFIYLGFRPKFFLWKVSSTTGSWGIIDTSRDTYNVSGKELFPNNSNAEASYTIADILSNGIKMRNTFADTNGSGSTYIYAAFAENPFKYANAR
jgi:hypothetical protein